MQQLLHIVSQFRTGSLDQAQLLARVAALLNKNGDNLDDVLAAVQQEHAIAPLPLGTFVALRKHLYAASAPKTIAMPSQADAAPPPVSVAAAAASLPVEQSPSPAAPPRSASASAPRVESQTTEEALAGQAIGAVLADRFRLIEFVGSGGTSRLYKAVDQRKVEAGADDPHVAVKVLTLPFKDTLEALAVLHRETEGLQQLAHPNIVRVIDCDRDGDTVFMIMEFIRGKTLHTLMHGSRFLGAGREECLPIIQGIANAVEFAHSKFIVHGDLTPGNVMVTATGVAKVIDFGIARIFGEPPGAQVAASDRRATSRGEITGVSPSYASPEVLEFREPDPRDDIYALACIVWELLTGSHPFGRRSSKTARDEGVKLEYDDKLTRTEYAALARALNFERAKRTSTVKQFIAELTASKFKRSVPYAAAAATLLAVVIGGYFYWSHAPQAPVAVSSLSATNESARLPQSTPSAAELPSAVPLATASAVTTVVPLAPGAVFRDCPTCPLMTALPAGEFLQGSRANAANAQAFEMPQHRVSIANLFAASRTEITVGEFTEFAQATGRDLRGCMIYDGEWKLQADAQWKNAAARQTASHPATCISWRDATEYVQWLSARTGQPYRLPSASEWEYAARAGSAADRPWTADAQACAVGNVADRGAAQRYPGWTVHNCNDSYVQAAPVASFAANEFGLHDMLGNVFEWVSDCWHDNYDGAPADGSARVGNERGGDCTQREMRGGSWFTAPGFVRFAYRNRFAADYRSSSVGFRVVREIAL